MKDNLASFRAPLRNFADVLSRTEASESIRPYLTKVTDGNWRTIYKDSFHESLWVEEFPFSEMQGGGPSAFYIIHTDDPDTWLKTAPYLSADLRRDKQDADFFSILGPELGPEPCRHTGCTHLRIKMSVFCRIHHFESVLGRPFPEHIQA